MIECTTEDREGVVVVRVTGSVDALTADTLGAALAAPLAAGRVRLVADLEAVDYTSSAGLRALLAALKDARTRGGDLRLARPQKGVLKVLQLSGFTSILAVHERLEDAVASFA